MKQFIITFVLCVAIVSLSQCQKINLLSNEETASMRLTSNEKKEIDESLSNCQSLADGQIRLPEYVSLNLRTTRKFEGALLTLSNSIKYDVPQVFNPFRNLGIQGASILDSYKCETVIDFDLYSGKYCFKKQYSWIDNNLSHVVSFILDDNGSFSRIEEELLKKYIATHETYWVSPIENTRKPLSVSRAMPLNENSNGN